MTEEQQKEIEAMVKRLKEIDETLEHGESRHVLSAIIELGYLIDDE